VLFDDSQGDLKETTGGGGGSSLFGSISTWQEIKYNFIG
jgi:hypothetical protein